MHITVVAPGSLGDVLPFVALGLGLEAEGHTLRIATHGVHFELVVGHDLEFAKIEGNPRALLERPAGQDWLGSGSNPLSAWRAFRGLVRETVEVSLADTVEACRGTNAIISTWMGSGGYHVAESEGVPHLLAALQPFSRTSEFPSFAAPPYRLGGLYNKWTYRMAEVMGWQLGARWVNRWRQDILGLKPYPFSGPFQRLYSESVPFVYGFSEHVVQRPTDWPESHLISGYWFMPDDEEWTPPSDLVDFLDAGPAPISIGFGSMAGEMARKTVGACVKAAEIAGKRAILLGGWGRERERSLPDTVFGIESAPHSWLFPRVSAVVHHGGAGTTAAGLRAGLPTVVIPFFLDQPFWGGRIHALGVGPKPLPRRGLTPGMLASAIKDADSNPEVRSNAAAMQEKLQGEDGVSRAVESILLHFAR